MYFEHTWLLITLILNRLHFSIDVKRDLTLGG